ncbi:MAG TPA: hypothetical protein VEK07_09480 [Polyangiaceae bacterium]|nr:hypothetical protein [Polyangiaceae bacterium]
MSSSSTAAHRPRLAVTVVSKNASTAQRLEAYLRDAGVFSNGTRDVERLVEMTPPSAAAAVVFPDEFDPEAVEAALRTARKQRPDLLLVVVTNEPRRFDKLQRGSAEEEDGLLVMAKPAWAWTILDAIRAKLDAARGVPPDRPAK